MKQFKKIRIYYLTPLGNKKESVFTAPPGRGYTEQQIHTQADFSLKRAQETFPAYTWRKVQIAPNMFNMIGEKKDDDSTGTSASDIVGDRDERMLEGRACDDVHLRGADNG